MTFTVVGYCPRTGQMGLALATSSIAAAARVAFAAPGVGVVATQARSDPRLGPLGLSLMADGKNAQDALTSIVAGSSQIHWRQLALVDARGGLAFFTGDRCMAPRGGRAGRSMVAIGNAVASEQVVEAMVAAAEADSQLDLPERLLRGLEAGVAAGGELYPLRSAGMLVVSDLPFPRVDLRADNSATPVADLRDTWDRFAVVVDGYIQRALDPDNAPFAAALEGHPEPARSA